MANAAQAYLHTFSSCSEIRLTGPWVSFEKLKARVLSMDAEIAGCWESLNNLSERFNDVELDPWESRVKPSLSTRENANASG